ncbi:hypothetical protein [Flavobacterium faecale]|uniref:hypothetical protein n=1 Tax=Flavobacterium faecale TaxID=1355330 RepID=UPI003AB01B05
MKTKRTHFQISLNLVLLIIFSNFGYAQFFIETNIGLNGALDPRIYNTGHTGFGAGYMYEGLIGLKLDYAKDNFSNDIGSSNSKRADMQLIANLSNAFFDKSYYDPFALLVHAGMGISNLRPSSANTSDTNINFMMGITPKYRIIGDLDITADASLIMNANQNYNFDGSPTYQNLAVPQTGFLFNLSLGLLYTFHNYR